VAYNVPSYNTSKITFGPGILYMDVAGSTPSTDVGAVREATLRISRERLDVEQGTPAVIIQTWARRESVEFVITGIEWNLANLHKALGGGNQTSSELGFGGDMNFNHVALKFVHQMASGGTIELDIWYAQGSGEMEIAFGDDVHQFPMTFVALHTPTAWSGESLDEEEQLIAIKHIT